MKTYLITWYVLLQDGSRINSKKPSRVTFCNNELHAKMKLEDYLKRTIPNFGSLICTECVESNAVSDLFRKFGW